MLSMEHGIVNEILVGLGFFDKPLNFFYHPNLFWWIVGFTNVWKETGWNSIIYLAAISAINPEMYEAAALDGAGRFGKIWHVTLPGIKPTIFILLLINLGNVLNVGFELQYLLDNDLIKSVSQTIDIYVLKWGISQLDFSLGTAAGIFKSVVSIILIFLANSAAKAAGEERLF
jgi:putative aldouronate transport system permease protein